MSDNRIWKKDYRIFNEWEYFLIIIIIIESYILFEVIIFMCNLLWGGGYNIVDVYICVCIFYVYVCVFIFSILVKFVENFFMNVY